MQREKKITLAENAVVQAAARAILSGGGLPLEQRHDHQCGDKTAGPQLTKKANQSTGLRKMLLSSCMAPFSTKADCQRN
jgi:hypothetical protein